MPATFDGPNLTITLPSSGGSGVANVNVEVDLYSDWKEWVLAGNAQFEQAFDTAAGDPLTATLDSGGYFFLRNDLGWRIKPAEEDVNYYFTGNLIPRDSTLEMLIPTTGAYTTAIFGLQPVTQNVDNIVSQTVAAMLAAAQADPIHANVKEVHDTAVTGSGTEADPWGP